MATIRYSSDAVQIDTVVWSGTNVDEIVALVGAQYVEYVNGVLTVNGRTLAINDVAAKRVGGTQVNGIPAQVITDDYTIV